MAIQKQIKNEKIYLSAHTIKSVVTTESIRTLKNLEMIMLVQKLSDATGFNLETIRYYRKLGFLKPVKNEENVYQNDDDRKSRRCKGQDLPA